MLLHLPSLLSLPGPAVVASDGALPAGTRAAGDFASLLAGVHAEPLTTGPGQAAPLQGGTSLPPTLPTLPRGTALVDEEPVTEQVAGVEWLPMASPVLPSSELFTTIIADGDAALPAALALGQPGAGRGLMSRSEAGSLRSEAALTVGAQQDVAGDAALLRFDAPAGASGLAAAAMDLQRAAPAAASGASLRSLPVVGATTLPRAVAADGVVVATDSDVVDLAAPASSVALWTQAQELARQAEGARLPNAGYELVTASAGGAPAPSASLLTPDSGAQRREALSQGFTMTAAPADPRFAEAVTSHIRVISRAGLQEATLHLHPAELGRLHITVSTESDQARVAFVTDNAAARDLIEQTLPRLRELLAQSGLQLGSSDVAEQSGSWQRSPDERTATAAQQISTPQSPDDAGGSIEAWSSLGQIDYYV